MVPIFSLLVILGTSLIVTRAAAVALEHTGLSRDAARFQARSAFTGVGFTTTARPVGEESDRARAQAIADHAERVRSEREEAGR